MDNEQCRFVPSKANGLVALSVGQRPTEFMVFTEGQHPTESCGIQRGATPYGIYALRGGCHAGYNLQTEHFPRSFR